MPPRRQPEPFWRLSLGKSTCNVPCLASLLCCALGKRARALASRNTCACVCACPPKSRGRTCTRGYLVVHAGSFSNCRRCLPKRQSLWSHSGHNPCRRQTMQEVSAADRHDCATQAEPVSKTSMPLRIAAKGQLEPRTASCGWLEFPGAGVPARISCPTQGRGKTTCGHAEHGTCVDDSFHMSLRAYMCVCVCVYT